MSGFSFLDQPLPIAMAHRGGAGVPELAGLENTMPAFAHAVGLGYRYLETDVHATRDGAVVAFHDPTLDRMAGTNGRIADIDADELRGVRIGSSGAAVPLLAEILTSWPDVNVNVDVKADAAVAPLVRLLTDHAALDRVCVGSFSRRRLQAVRAAAGPRLCTSLSPPEVVGLRAAAYARRRWAAPPAGCVQVPLRAGPLTVVDERLLSTAHAAGLQVHVWTVDDPSTMTRLLDLGVDGLITDRTDLLRGVLVARGSWAAP